MWGWAIAAVLAYGLVRAAAAEPVRKEERDGDKLVRLAGMPAAQLTAAQAADGIVLARRFHQPALVKYFEGQVKLRGVVRTATAQDQKKRK